jgi:hypothetical protein
VALFHDVARAVFSAPALGGYTQVALDVGEVLALTGVANNFSVGDPMAYANNHIETVQVKYLSVINCK